MKPENYSTAMTSAPARMLSRWTLTALRALILGVACAATAFADDLGEAQRLLRQGNYEQAREKIDAVLTESPRDAQGRFLRGVLLSATQQRDAAIAVFSGLTEDYPEMPEPYNNLAVLYAEQKQYEQARRALEMAVHAHPSYATAHENLGDIYATLARQSYDRASRQEGASRAVVRKLALTREILGTAEPGKATPAPAAVR